MLKFNVRSSLLLVTWVLSSACSSEQSSPAGDGVGTSDSTTTSNTGSTSNTSTSAGGSSTTTGSGATSAPTSTGSVSTSTPGASDTGSTSSGSGADSVTTGESSGPTSDSADSSSAAATSGESSAQETSSGQDTSDSEPPPSPLPPTDDYSKPGPFETTSQTNTGPDGTYTIVRPTTLGADGFLHAPITFGPGTGMEVSQMLGLLERIASHGFVIISRKLEGGPRDAVTRMRMIGGLDWIIEQNSTSGSVFEGKLDVTHAVAMGYSVGGTGAVEIGGHEAIATVVSIHGHQAEGELRGPLLLMGGTKDVMGGGESWLAPTYEASKTQTFFSLVVDADHGYIQGTHGGVPGGVETPAMIAWLRYWIYNDTAAQRYFVGEDCVMCKEPWSTPQWKNWP